MDVQFVEAGDSLSAAVYIQFAVDMLEMHLNRAGSKKQFPGNRIIGEPLGDQMQYFEFAGGERINERRLESGGIGMLMSRCRLGCITGKRRQQSLRVLHQAHL